MAFAPGTVKNLMSQWKKFANFSKLIRKDTFPISTDLLCLYIQFLSRSLSSPQSVRNYVSGLKTVHLLCSLPFPSYDAVMVKLTFRGLDKLLCHVPRRAVPITPRILVRIGQSLDFNNTDHVVYWCLFLFMFFTFARKSQFVPVSGKDPLLPKLVQRQDAYVYKGFLRVQFKWTKTRQVGGVPLLIPLPPIPGSILCPITAFQRMLQVVPAPPCSPLFVLPSSSGLSPIFYRFFHKILRECLSGVGLDPTGFSSHSFRRGGASYAFSLGVLVSRERCNAWASVRIANYRANWIPISTSRQCRLRRAACDDSGVL